MRQGDGKFKASKDESLRLWTLLPVDGSLLLFEVVPERFASRHLWPLLQGKLQRLRRSCEAEEQRETALGMGAECVPGN